MATLEPDEQPKTDIASASGPGRSWNALPSDEVLAEAVYMWSLDVPLRQIAGWLDKEHDIRVPPTAIQRWMSVAKNKMLHVDPARLNELRAKEAMRLDALMMLAMRQAYELKGTKLGLAAIGQAVQVSRQFSLLMGANMPVRHDISMTVETEQDRALKAMLEQAALKARQDETRVIEAASSDPDL
jgi:hypothetical protein